MSILNTIQECINNNIVHDYVRHDAPKSKYKICYSVDHAPFFPTD